MLALVMLARTALAVRSVGAWLVPGTIARVRGAVRTMMLALLVAAAGLAGAQDLQPLPELNSPVVDTTGTLTADQIERLATELRAFEARKGSQIAVVFVPTTQPEAIEQYSIRLAEKAKVGRKKADDGVIVLVVTKDRKTRIEVGYGLEGAIPDIVANQIRRDVMNPYFRNGDFYGGVRAGTQALIKRADGEALPPPWQGEPQRGTEVGADYFEWILIGMVLVVVLGGVLKAIFGRFLGSAMVGGMAGTGAGLLSGIAFVGIGVGVLAFVFSLMLAGMLGGFNQRRGRYRGPWTGGWGGGGWSSGGGSGGGDIGGWSGGGGSFGGGGASGSWDD